MTTKTKSTTKYHHGDLQASLVETASEMINTDGIEGLSLRKLAEKIGVSRTAAYHHFKDKNDLLCAIASQGFIKWQKTSDVILTDESLTPEQKYRQFVHAYINFAANNPSLYELMFGSTIWKNNQGTDELKSVAYASFQYQVDMTKAWQEKHILPANEDSLRLSQVMWATLHGIAHLLIDGIYADKTQMNEMCECAVRLYLSQTSN